MRPRLPHLLPLAAALLVPGALLAQSGSGRGGPGRGGEAGSGAGRPITGLEAQHERRDAMRERIGERRGPERDALRERRRDREAALAPDDRAALAAALRARDGRAGRTPEQAAFAQQLREQRRTLREAVAAGTLDRHAAAEQLRAWIAAHRPNAPASP